MGDIDLARLASGYAHRPASPSSLGHAADAIAGLPAGTVALDIGGGRGEHAAVWADAGATAVVIDRSPDMALAASDHPGVFAVVAASQEMPIAADSAGLVYFHLSIHYGDWRAALGEARRVLAPGGRLVVWTLSERHHRASILARWFPSVGDIDAARFPEADEIADEITSLGFEVSRGQSIESVVRRAGDWIEAVEAGFVSTLQLLPEGELAEGLAAFRLAHPGEDDEIGYTLDWDWISAAKAE